MSNLAAGHLKVGIISDTHGDEDVCRQIWQTGFHGADLIIHAGDVLYHGPRNPIKKSYNPAGLLDFLNASPVPLLIARGNCDSDVDRFVLQYPLSPFLFLQFGDLRIMVEHGDAMGLDKQYMAAMGKKYGLRLFITGHTHVRMLERVDDVVILNPGSASLPKGDGVPSFAVLEKGRVQIISVVTGEVLEETMI